MKNLKARITPSLVISMLALFVALGGASYAAIGKNSVGSKQLKKNAVTSKKIKKNAVTAKKIKKNAVTGAKVKESSLSTVPEATHAGSADSATNATNATNATSATSATNATNADHTAGYSTFPQTKFNASGGANYAAARNAAAKHVIFKSGPITIYEKCFTDASGPKTYSVFYGETSVNGVIFGSDEDDLSGNPFLDTDTLEDDRELLTQSATANSTDYDLDSSYAASFMTPSGVAFEAEIEGAVKNGSLPGGNGVYGSGNICLATAAITEFTG